MFEKKGNKNIKHGTWISACDRPMGTWW